MNPARFTILLEIVLLLKTLHLSAQENQLIAPDDWRKEQLDLPLSFAPSIPITGIEEVRFAPGWGKPNDQEFFTYAFAWFLNEPISPKSEDLEQYLVAYFDGLMKIVGGYEQVGTTVQVNGNQNEFQGFVTTKDAFFTKDAITLHFTIENLDQDKIWIFRLSPKALDDEIWQKLNEQVRLASR